MSLAFEQLYDRFAKASQAQVFRYYEELSVSEQKVLLAQLEMIDLSGIEQSIERGASQSLVDFTLLKPATYIQCPRREGDPALWKRATAYGEEALRTGRVAVLTPAGGQGTRLKHLGPKGSFPISILKQKSFFQLFAEKIRAAENRYACSLYWFLMTSPFNHKATTQFFETNDYFGFAKERLHFFSQGLTPVVDDKGKFLLADKGQVAMSPDGHGGVFRSLVRSGAVEWMAAQGIAMVSYFQVDNPLISCVDPAFIGFHVMEKAEMSSKIVPKAYPEEKVGVFCLYEGKPVVIEYMDMPLSLQNERSSDGVLRYNAANIATHIFSRDFVEKMGDLRLPYHFAKKKIWALVDCDGCLCRKEVSAFTIETFSFDALFFAKKAGLIEASRQEEFSPVKNAEGVNSPQECRKNQLRQFARWFQSAGVSIPTDADLVPTISVEVSPLFATDQKTFVEKWKRLQKKPDVQDGLYLE